MKFRTFRILLSQGWTRVLCSVSLFVFSMMSTKASAQKAGDVISGVVKDKEGPVMMVNVTERDTANRIVAHCVTDINGEFAFNIKDPSHSLEISYTGYHSVVIPITKTYYEIKLEEDLYQPKVEIDLDRMRTTAYGPMFPNRLNTPRTIKVNGDTLNL